MKPLGRQFCFSPSVLAVAMLAAFGPAHAQDSEVEAFVTGGVGAVTGDASDRALFGQYNGLRDRDAYGLLDFGYARRNAASGTLAQFYGSNLLLDTRELDLLWKRQGNWRFSLNYSELLRRDPYAVNTGLIGAGTTTPQVVYLGGGPGTGLNFDLETKRKGLGAGFAKWLSPVLEFEASLKSENKDGSRLYGIGFACPSAVAPACGPTTATNTGSAVLLLPEPINSNHSQAEARLNYAGRSLWLSGGYYGSFYSNSNGAMTPGIPGTLNNPLGSPLPLSAGLQAILSNPVALPPDNQFHQFDIGGNYAFNPTTRARFKLAYGTARQDQDFAGAGLTGAPTGVSNLGGRVDTTSAQFAVTARPLPKLSLLADWRYEDRNDKTPLAAYNIEGTAPLVTTFTNRVYSKERVRGKLQATYQFPNRLQGTVGADYEYIDRGSFTASSAVRGVSALRQETEELGFRLELRRQMTETISGSISLITSDRDGSNWLQPNAGTGVTEISNNALFGSTAIFSPNLADRKRDKVRLFGSWQATESLSLQLSAEEGKDKFTMPSAYALRDSRVSLYSLDGNYIFSETWSVNGFLSQSRQKLNQARPAGYVLAFDNKSFNAGLGMVGKPSETLDLGGSLGWINDKSAYAQSLDPLASANSAALLAATGGLPDILYRRTEVRLFGKYALTQRSALRLDAIYQRSKYDDWAYGFNDVLFTYGDNTTVTQQQSQNAGYVGISYTYFWR